MAEAQLKRHRSEDPKTSGSDDASPISKFRKLYGSILSLLDQDEDDEGQDQDLSAVFSTLQQEISSSSTAAFYFDLPAAADRNDGSRPGEDDRAESVMRRLLEASDDELGIPNTEELCNKYIDNINYNNSNNDENIDGIRFNDNLAFGFVDTLWEIDDVAANYYAMLQSELFM